MPKIALLDSTVSDQIAAGEVVERPSSVVKELVENALDAGAKRVRVEVEQAGRALIRVSDDGEGMDRVDLVLSVRRHATSKIRAASDLGALNSFGFRGEALPSIASVSFLSLTTRALGSAEAWRLDVEGGRVGEAEPAGRAHGTTLEVRRLFYNTPARLKFLKSDGTETGRMVMELSQMALARPDVAFELLLDGRSSLDLPAAKPEERLRRLWGASLAGAALPVDHAENGIHVRGWVSPPALSRGRREGQWLFVNGRVVEYRQLGFHLSQAYGTLLPHGRHAVAALFLDVPLDQVDVNVHPAKREVRFIREPKVLDCLRHGVVEALRAANLFADVALRPGEYGGAFPTPGSPHAGIAPGYAAFAPGSPSWAGERGASPPGVGAGFVQRRNGRFGPSTRLGGAWNGPAPVFPAPVQNGELLPRGADTAQPSHVAPSSWGLPVAAPNRPDWPVPLAQLHRSYLLCQDSQGLVVVDQHAAHERVLYERQLRAFAQGGVKIQRLLLPQRLQVTPVQAPDLEARIPALAELGLELESVGGGLFFISALPEFMKLTPASSLLLDLLEGGAESQPASGDPAEDLRREAAAGLACRAAIKAGDPIIWEAMQRLMADLAACEIPWCCPHGRPPLVRLTLAELEKYFQRR